MPTFPQHRNIRNVSKPNIDQNDRSSMLPNSSTVNDQTLNLPAISDLLGSIVKKRRLD